MRRDHEQFFKAHLLARSSHRALMTAIWALANAGLAAAAPVACADPPDAAPLTVTNLSAEQLFELAGRMEHDGQTDFAERIYTALAGDPHLEVRNEARFRHAGLLTKQREFDKAAALYRAILEEQPDAPRVRIELAGVLAQAGDMSGARRELESAQTHGLPPDVARIVDQYAAALRSKRPYGASLELGLAPTNNINRATTATTLDTVLAPFQLSEDARAKSGVGVRVGSQAFFRAPISRTNQFVFRLAGEGSIYKRSSFNDVVGSAQVGLESDVGDAKVRPFVGRSYRWYGNDFYATTDTVSLEVERPLGEKDRITTDFGFGRADYQLNKLQDGDIYTGNVVVEHSFTAVAGAGVGVSFQRQGANDPGYATTSGGFQLLLWQRLGQISLFADSHVSRLEADERLALFPERRKEWQYATTLGATLSQLAFHGFAPVLRVSYERNDSTVGIYNYSRLAGDVGFTRAF
jgi:hypothetical protein